MLRSEAEGARKREEEERKQENEDEKRRFEEYTSVHGEMQGNEHIQAILTQNKVLTGDDVRPGDAGYEFEVPPKGQHVTLLFNLLILLGFESLDKTKKETQPRTPSPTVVPETAAQLSVQSPDAKAETSPGERWWDDELAAAWTTLQELYHAELCDGVVEAEVLQKVLVPPVGHQMLRNNIMEELENREDQDEVTTTHRRSSGAGADLQASSKRKKPSIETLCQRLGITMSRMEWLHRLFESFLQPDEKDPNTVPVCLYPECPAAIKKTQMRSLMKEVRPEMEEVEFEMRFRRIDTDLSGSIEFDEFVMWVREDEVRVGGAAPLQKMSFEELSVVYGESVELIKYLYDHWGDKFPPADPTNPLCAKGDDYPANPKSLEKVEVRALVSSLTPDMSDADFETSFQMTTFSKKDTLEFDEFLEVLPIDELPPEIREMS